MGRSFSSTAPPETPEQVVFDACLLRPVLSVKRSSTDVGPALPVLEDLVLQYKAVILS